MSKQLTEKCDMTAQEKKNTLRVLFWTFGWLLATALATFGPEDLWDYSTVPTIIGVVAQLGVGFGMIIANKQHLVGLDELQQKIQLEAMAITLGVVLVVGLSYGLLEDIKLISFTPDISHIIVLMSLTYVFGVFIGQRRYR